MQKGESISGSLFYESIESMWILYFREKEASKYLSKWSRQFYQMHFTWVKIDLADLNMINNWISLTLSLTKV